MENTFLSNLEWRNAEKHFDPSKKVSDEDLAKVLDAIKMAPSSFGLQPVHIYVVSDQETKLKLKEKGFNQQQIEDASHVLVFCGRNDLTSRINQYFEMLSGGDAEKRASTAAYEGMMNGFAEGKSPDQVMAWASKQAYLSLGFALAACAELKIDSCPMEGFDPQGFNEVLSIPTNMSSVVIMTIGYRNDEAHMPKVRFSGEDIFTKI